MLLFWKESSSAQSQEHKHAPSPQSNLSGLGWRLRRPSTLQREAQGGWAADRGWPFSGQWPLNGCADWGLTMSPVRVWAGRGVESCRGARQMVLEINCTYDLSLQREQLLGIQYIRTAVQPWSVSSGTFPSPRASPEPASGHHVPSPGPHPSARSHHGFTCSGCSTEMQSHALCSWGSDFSRWHGFQAHPRTVHGFTNNELPPGQGCELSVASGQGLAVGKWFLIFHGVRLPDLFWSMAASCPQLFVPAALGDSGFLLKLSPSRPAPETLLTHGLPFPAPCPFSALLRGSPNPQLFPVLPQHQGALQSLGGA